MSRFFIPVLLIHVVVAVLGLGSILAIAIVAAASRKAGRSSLEVSAWLNPLLRFSAISLGAMFITGVLMDLVAGGTFHDRWWFRGSTLLVLITGVMHARARRLVKGRLGPEDEDDAALRRVERLAYAMSALIGVIAVLMEVKPF